MVEEEQFPYGQEYISLLARQGKIESYKEGRNWLTIKAVEDVNGNVDNRESKFKSHEFTNKYFLVISWL